MKHKIIHIDQDSVAEELGIKEGSFLLEMNHAPLKDRFDYLYGLTNEEIHLLIEDEEELIDYEFSLDEGENLGLEFESGLMDDAKSCKNNCVFCFIDQLPPGLRESLYFKDDDSRLSFMQGNFLTLTNMSDEDLSRIAELGIHPINISVHTLDPELRLKMLKNPKSRLINEQIQFLHDKGVTMNAQIVVVPGYNDGEDLLKTLEGLSNYYPLMHSVAIVPLGLTKHRENCINLKPVDQCLSHDIIKRVHGYQEQSLKERGTRFAFLADEFYLKAGVQLPGEEAYEGFLHYEDGIGMIRQFLTQWEEATSHALDYRREAINIVTAEGFYPYLQQCIETLNQEHQTSIKVIPVKNHFLGHQVNVTGLLSFSDILRHKDELEGEVLLCETMFNQDGLSLDDKTVGDLEEHFKTITLVAADAFSLVDALRRSNE